MERRPLGRSGLEVSRLILGCGNFGGIGSAPALFGQGESREEAFALMDAAWKLGIVEGKTAFLRDFAANFRDDGAYARFLDRQGPGLQQLAYRVTDIDAACDALRAHGLRVLYDTPRRGTANSHVNFVHPKDAGGVLVELVQPAS